MNVILQGKVLAETGTPIDGAIVQVIGRADTLSADPRAATNNPTSVSWTRQITGLTGNRWDCWLQFVAQEVSGITWDEFKNQVVVYNPSLNATGMVFEADRIYKLPENRALAAAAPAIVWDRELTGYFGHRWDCWTQFVQQKVVSLTWQQFADEVVVQNPQLAADGFVFQADKRYQLPRNAAQAEYIRLAVTDANGLFELVEMPQGDYRLEIRAAGYQAKDQNLPLAGDAMMEFRLKLVPLLLHIPDDFVQSRGTQFSLRGQPFSFIGVNIRGLAHYGNSQALPFSQEGDHRTQLQAASSMGVRVVRCFLANRHIAHSAVVDRFRTVLNLIKQEFPHIYVIPALTDLYDDSFGHPQGDDVFYTAHGHGHTLLNKAWFAGGYKQNYLQFVELAVNNFKDEPNIFAWEIGNELKIDNEPDLFIEFNHAVAARIRALDDKHLITTGMISTRHAYLDSTAQKHKLYRSSDIDFVTNHAYNGEFVEDDSALAAQLNKPLILEEAGFDAGPGQDRGRRVAENMQAWFGRGARGYMQWGFKAGTIDNGDGDRNSGMDRLFHTDWDSLFAVYKTQADRLSNP